MQDKGSPRRRSKCKVTPGKTGREFKLGVSEEVNKGQGCGRKGKGRAKMGQ